MHIQIKRPSWDEYWMQVAQVISTRSTCIRRQIGCVITLDNLIISSGYNGSCRKLENCSDTQVCLRDAHQIPSGTRLETCLHGDTVIKCLDGSYKTIRELAESKKDVWIYAYDTKTNKVVPALGKSPRKTGVRNDLLKITLDDGSSFMCTKDHRILKRNGEYAEAQHLHIGSSLMPMYYNFSARNGYEAISNTIRTRKEYERIQDWKEHYAGRLHSTPTHKHVCSCFNEKKNKNDVVHHINGNVLDNRPENLVFISLSEHTKHHSHENPIQITPEQAKQGLEKQRQMLENDPEFLQHKRDIGHKNMTKNWQSKEYRKMLKPTQVKNGKVTAQKTNSDKNAIRSRMIGKIRSGISRLIFMSNGELTEKNYAEVQAKYPIQSRLGATGPRPPRIPTILKYYESIDAAIDEARRHNHKIVSIRKVCGKHDVFDMTVPKYENFAIMAKDNSCIFVHNCAAAHAEQNALLNLPFNLKQYTLKSQCAVFNTPKPTMYVTTYPCPICAKLLIQAGIRRIVCYSAYSNQDAMELLAQAGVEVCWTNT